MLEVPHVALGVALATKIPNPIISVPLAIGSHLILDMLPHWNPHLNTEMRKYGKITTKTKAITVLDFATSLGIIGVFAFMAPSDQQALNISLAGFSTMIPDLIEAPYFFLHHKTILLEKWIRFQKSIQTDAGPIWGVATQIAVAILSLYWALH